MHGYFTCICIRAGACVRVRAELRFKTKPTLYVSYSKPKSRIRGSPKLGMNQSLESSRLRSSEERSV